MVWSIVFMNSTSISLFESENSQILRVLWVSYFIRLILIRITQSPTNKQTEGNPVFSRLTHLSSYFVPMDDTGENDRWEIIRDRGKMKGLSSIDHVSLGDYVDFLDRRGPRDIRSVTKHTIRSKGHWVNLISKQLPIR